MTKQELSQLKHLNREIGLLRQQIRDVENMVNARMTVDSVTGSSPEFPYIQHTFRIEGIDLVGYERRVKRLKNKLNRRLQELILKKEELEDYIASIPDSEMRTILTLRYVNGLSWQQVALQIGEYDESYPRRKHNRFLELAENAEK